ncbi:O-antigen ligase family protein [Mesorhizobium australicum]|uniref:O-antigen ligase n=1 Tax=Mesorhizobium australicum TaxID=536018 RepID=A0A1X7NQ09_9HYPH|nr:O-antigen ligase [Mesorhizobium australicum]SMH39209.1 O-antigen ligase [Mesorhizobium australicum]
MNSTALPRRIDWDRIADAFTARRIGTILASVMLTVVIVSFKPFQPAPAPGVQEGGDIVNQLGFGSLGALAIFSLACFVDRRVLMSLISPWWLIVLGFLALSVMHATDPPSALRAAIFTLVGILTIAAVLTVPRDADSLSTIFAFAGLVTVGLCYFGLIAFPGEAIHSADSLEPQHAGFWRGSFSHKNIAGPVMACLSFMGLYLWRRGWRWIGALLFAGAMLFMANTGSKTTAGLVPMAILLVMLPGIIGLRRLVPLIFALAIVGTALGTLGIVFIAPLKHLAAEYFPGMTYTGRTALWEFSGEMIAKRPWTGYGFESFWGTMFVFTMDQPFDRDWDIRGIVHGHNGYLDIAVIMGVPALIAAVIAFLVVPLSDYLRSGPRRENVLLADMFMMMLLFTALNAFLESFFFRRADPVWLFFVMATLGLRLVARHPVPTRIPD